MKSHYFRKKINRWDKEEEKKLVQFCKKNKSKMKIWLEKNIQAQKTKKLESRFFNEMSSFVKSKSVKQCKSKFQNYEKKILKILNLGGLYEKKNLFKKKKQTKKKFNFKMKNEKISQKNFMNNNFLKNKESIIIKKNEEIDLNSIIISSTENSHFIDIEDFRKS